MLAVVCRTCTKGRKGHSFEHGDDACSSALPDAIIQPLLTSNWPLERYEGCETSLTSSK